MGGRRLPTMAVLVAAALTCSLQFAAPAGAGPTPSQTIAAIQAKEEAAVVWIDNRANEYYDFLATNPTPSAAAAERDRALADIAAKAAEADEDISGKMEQHPNNQDVQEAGEDAIANVYSTADSESTAIIQAYNAYVGGGTTTTTTPSTTTTKPPATTTTTSPPSTTTTTSSVTTSTTQTVAETTTSIASGSPAGSSPTTTVPQPTTTTGSEDEPPPQTSEAQSGEDEENGVSVPIGGSGPTRPGLIAAGNLNPDPRLTAGSIAAVKPVDIGPVLDMLRLRLPTVLSEPLVDLLVVLSAIAAAFMSGIRAIGWPTAALLSGFLAVQGIQALRRRGLARQREPSTRLAS